MKKMIITSLNNLILTWAIVMIGLFLSFCLPLRAEARGDPALLLGFNGAVNSKGFPVDWKLKVHKGHAEAGVASEGGEKVLLVRADNSSFAFEHSLEVDSRDYPYLTWTWKALSLPSGGDVRDRSRDDQVLQLLVAFEDGKIISYVWDSNAPRGTLVDRSLGWPFSIEIRVMVVNSGGSEIGKWLTNTRNLYRDYERLFHGEPPPVKGIRLQTNTQHTGDSAEGALKEIAFRK